MKKILEKLYFFTKLSSSLLLLLIVFLLIFLFIKSYQKQSNLTSENFTEKIEQNYSDINQKLEKTNKSILDIVEKINLIENELNSIKNNGNVNNSENLKKEIDKINNLINSHINKIQIGETNKKNLTILESNQYLIEKHLVTISLSIENGLEFKFVVNELIKLIDYEPQKQYVEKLSLFSDGSILSYNELKKNFELTNDIYLKKYFLKQKNNSGLFRFLLKFLNLKTDNKNISEDITIRTLSIANNYLNEKKISNAIDEVSKINYNPQIFDEWLIQAKKYSDANDLIDLIRNEID